MVFRFLYKTHCKKITWREQIAIEKNETISPINLRSFKVPLVNNDWVKLNTMYLSCSHKPPRALICGHTKSLDENGCNLPKSVVLAREKQCYCCPCSPQIPTAAYDICSVDSKIEIAKDDKDLYSQKSELRLGLPLEGTAIDLGRLRIRLQVRGHSKDRTLLLYIVLTIYLLFG